MVHAIRIHETGGPDVLRWEEVAVGDPGPGEVRLRHTAVGLNFIDTYHRSGLYPQPLPFVPGMEAAGVVEAVGEGVTGFAPGDRVGYCSGPIGAYAEARLIPAQGLVALPDWLDDRTAAAMLLQGMTAQYLLRRTYRVNPGDSILIHAAAGGVGLIVCQWANALGATVIGTVGSEEKAELARAHGCHHAINYTREDFVARVKEITGGRGVDVVYDSVGADTFLKSMDCLRRLGMLVSFGQSSGKLAPLDTGLLAAKGALFLTRPSLFHYVATRAELEETAADLFAVVKDGTVKVEVRQTFPLRDAAEAHRALEARRTTGSTVLLP
ncbi:quinone oxidoreductase family protein [Rhodospirillum centenum]|uniref:Quinone oxidoreductase n=1 Tax=Rhodospirillum centenum (strain ATCC 51521 / SW) TaxID=414684 RepID=B6IV52_RHOCS|nr:quinone oxidoreductase [Rhodospirillum centenum]ACJ00176.1 quinone oxidoreductase [Rhodospirillum centenum SW]